MFPISARRLQLVVSPRVCASLVSRRDLTACHPYSIQCNGYSAGGQSGSAPAPIFATVAAGSQLRLNWTAWPDSHKVTRFFLSHRMTYSHVALGSYSHLLGQGPLRYHEVEPRLCVRSPVMDQSAYLLTPSIQRSAVWFKVAESGKTSSGQWAATDLLKATNWVYTFTIPASLQPGQYIVRHEIIALHSAWQYP